MTDRNALVLALTDIAYVAEHGQPVEGKDPNAVANWIKDRANDALRQDSSNASPRAPSPDACAECGLPRKEHAYNGACYGLCGKFVERPAPAALKDVNQYGETLAIATARADDNGRSCEGFADALRTIDPNNPALAMPWMTAPVPAPAAAPTLVSEIKRLRGTLEYILAQAKAKHSGVLSVIEMNAATALDDKWQDAIRDMKSKLEHKSAMQAASMTTRHNQSPER